MRRDGAVGRLWDSYAIARALPLILAAVVVTVLLAVILRSVFDESAGGDARGEPRAESQNGAVESGGVTSKEKANSSQEEFRVATKAHRNPAGGYRFFYPPSWNLTREQSVSRVSRPDDHFIVTFGLGPVGGLPNAYDGFVALLDQSYNDVDVYKVDATKVQENVGVLVRGAATTTSGIRVRFKAAVIGGKNDNRAIGALAATDFDSGEFPRAVNEILESFRRI
jgi:hypothetical protein